jgi:hemerythrin superfamily protein
LSIQDEIRREQEKLIDNASIFDILKMEHKDIKKLFRQIADSGRYQDNVYNDLKTAFAMHMAGEERYLYPRLENNAETRSLVLGAYEEHDLCRKIISDIDKSSDMDIKFAKAKVLGETIDMHVKMEEDNLFKRARRVLSNEDEREIAQQFMAGKMQNLSGMAAEAASAPAM